MSGPLRPEFSLKTAVLLASIAGTVVALNLAVISLVAENASATQDGESLETPVDVDLKGSAIKVMVIDVTVPVDVQAFSNVDAVGVITSPLESSSVGSPGLSPDASSPGSLTSPTTPGKPTSTASTTTTVATTTTSPAATVPSKPVSIVTVPPATTQAPTPDDDDYDDDSYEDDDGSEDSTSSTTQPVATQTEYLYYSFDGVATSVVVALHDGNRIEFWSATPVDGWTFRLDDASDRQIEVEFFHAASGEEAKFKVEFEGANLIIKKER